MEPADQTVQKGSGPGSLHAPNEGSCILTLQTSHRVTPGISLHTFSCPMGTDHDLLLGRSLRPTQHTTLQFPPDLDPIWGSRNLTEDDRRLTLTPCCLWRDAVVDSPETTILRSIDFLVRNGRVTGLLGLPRPGHDLTAQLVDVGGGFPAGVVESAGRTTCVAGGTGVSCFLALGSSGAGHVTEGQRDRSLFWSIRADDFKAVEFVLESGMLRVDDWISVRVFVTAGDESQIAGGLLAGKPAAWWQDRFSHLGKFGAKLSLKCGRMNQDYLNETLNGGGDTILFCGSKSLEWQVRMWSLNSPVKVYRTDR